MGIGGLDIKIIHGFIKATCWAVLTISVSTSKYKTFFIVLEKPRKIPTHASERAMSGRLGREGRA
jgi:hypothetical protein